MLYDPEIEKTTKKLRKGKKKKTTLDIAAEGHNQNNQQQMALSDYFKPVVNYNYSSIQRLIISS